MRRYAALFLASMLVLPSVALAQDDTAPPDQAGAQPPPPSYDGAPPTYQPGTIPNAPPLPLVQPPLPGQDDTSAPPPAGGHKPHAHDAAMLQKYQAKFDAANTTHDGRLTLQQAQAANLRLVVKHFSQIDTAGRGYVTFNEVMAWRLEQEAQKMQQRAAALRAQDGQ